MNPDKHTTLSDFSDPQTNTAAAGDNLSRITCTRGCERPTNVCLCDTISTDPIATATTQVVILLHPHERRHKLATVPVLVKCLKNCQTLIGRRLRLGNSPLLDSLYNSAVENPSQSLRTIYLFPGTDSSRAIEVSRWQSSLNDSDISTMF
ncbi:DTW domain-containing protein [Actinidia chinensis var. chinensis]|uniref:tRNA-uridine aminocarboxypropyltransferase n=1 Tax=Actinidia chinensis var. chinensis TaxID=1590841 RepID=A0A2R6QV99_ACTCC|nr:DTW domain-containing protein [Actinidia chinensis var. chinensis]